jgi:hypothetical protein
MMMFPQRMQGKKTKMRLQKRGMQQYKKCLKYIKTQHPNMSRDELHDVLNSIYEEKYSGSNKIALYYRTLISSPDSSQAKGLKVYYKLLQFWKASDQGRTPRLVSEQNEEFNEKIKNRQGKPMQLFTLLPVKSSFTMSNILIDKKALMDLILGDKGRNIGEAHAGLYKTVRKLVAEDYMSVLQPFFDIEWFETRTKKHVHFITDGIPVTVLLGEECEPKPKACKTKRKQREEDDEPTVSSASYDIRVGLDPGLRYLFVAKNNTNEEDKTALAKMSSKGYYHESKFNWNISKQKKCYARCSWWKEVMNGDISSEAWGRTYKKYSWWKEEMVNGGVTPKTHVMSELKKYAVYALSYLDKALELHFKNPFRKWRFKKHIYKQKTFVKNLQRITTKKSELDKKQVIVGFGNWGNPRDSII